MTWSSRGNSEKWGILFAHSTKANSCLSAVWQMLVTASWGWNQTTHHVYLSVIQSNYFQPNEDFFKCFFVCFCIIRKNIYTQTHQKISYDITCEFYWFSYLKHHNHLRSCLQSHHQSEAQSSVPQQSLPPKSSPRASPRLLQRWTPAPLHALGSSAAPPGPLHQTKRKKTVSGEKVLFNFYVA